MTFYLTSHLSSDIYAIRNVHPPASWECLPGSCGPSSGWAGGPASSPRRPGNVSRDISPCVVEQWDFNQKILRQNWFP